MKLRPLFTSIAALVGCVAIIQPVIAAELPREAPAVVEFTSTEFPIVDQKALVSLTREGKLDAELDAVLEVYEVDEINDSVKLVNQLPVTLPAGEGEVEIEIPTGDREKLELELLPLTTDVELGVIAETSLSGEVRRNNSPRATSNNSASKVSFKKAAYTVKENLTNFVIQLTRTGNLTATGSVNFEVVGGNAQQGNDYRLQSGAVSFARGEANKSIPVHILDDSFTETNEIIVVRITSPSGQLTLGNTTNATITIKDNESVLQFDTATRTVRETAAQVVLKVARLGAIGERVTIQYRTVGGSASEGNDFVGKSGTLTFAPGERFKNIMIGIKKDATHEGNESFVVELFNPGNGGVLGSPGTATVHIQNVPPPLPPKGFSATINGAPFTPITQTALANAGSFSLTLISLKIDGFNTQNRAITVTSQVISSPGTYPINQGGVIVTTSGLGGSGQSYNIQPGTLTITHINTATKEIAGRFEATVQRQANSGVNGRVTGTFSGKYR
jgi:hypothetical protein